MHKKIPILLRGNREVLTVEYTENTSAAQSGFDALDVPFPKECCIGYPTLHAYFQTMQATGYKRLCAFIQFVQRVEQRNGCETTTKLSLDVDAYFRQIGNPFFSYGYPASLFDAPCKNLGDCDQLTWTSFTYLVDMPSRMNQNKLSYITGFSWGYIEDIHGPVKLLAFEMLSENKFAQQYALLSDLYPHYAQCASLNCALPIVVE